MIDMTPPIKPTGLPDDSGFEQLITIANRQTKRAKFDTDEQAVFGLYSPGVATSRDEWVYDFDAMHLGAKVREFINIYEESSARFDGNTIGGATLGTEIKWTRDLKRQLRLHVPNSFDESLIVPTAYRPFTGKYLYYSHNLNEMRYQQPLIFPTGNDNENNTICFCVNNKDF